MGLGLCYKSAVSRSVIALDFDGVIADSAGESFDVALLTYAEFRPESALVSLVDPKHPKRDALYRDFLVLMALGNRAEDYAVALDAIENGRPIPDQSAYDRAFSEHDSEFLLAFHRRLYENRDRLRDADPERWCRGVPAYPGFADLLSRRQSDAHWCIATAKDRPSVDLLLESYGLREVFDSTLICDKTLGRDKAAHMGAIADRLRVMCGEITFVDDKLNHLDSVAPLGVRCVLAAWGYNGEREQNEARERGFAVADLDDVEEILLAGD